MLRCFLLSLLMPALAVAAPVFQTATPGASGGVLGTVTISASVLAGGAPLPVGTYQLRLADDAAPSNPAQRRVEFVANGAVAAREVAEVLRDADLPAVGDSARPSTDGVRVEMLKGNEFLRISVKRDGVRYLVHLPVAR